MISNLDGRQVTVAKMISSAGGDTLITVLQEGLPCEFVRYPEKLSIPMPREAVDSIFVAGHYASSKCTATDVQFLADGKRNGLSPYTRYEVGVDFIAAPDFDYVILSDKMHPLERDVYHGRASGDTLRSYATRAGIEKMLAIDTLFAVLIRRQTP